jgi:uncharacterized protein
MKVVLDTNIVASRYMSPAGPPARLYGAWEAGRFTVLVSESMLREYRRTLSYEKLRSRHHMGDKEIDAVIAGIRARAAVIRPATVDRVVQADPDDDEIIACAIAGGADYIVTGDSDLLSIGEYQGVRIVTPAEMLAILDAGGSEE